MLTNRMADMFFFLLGCSPAPWGAGGVGRVHGPRPGRPPPPQEPDLQLLLIPKVPVGRFQGAAAHWPPPPGWVLPPLCPASPAP